MKYVIGWDVETGWYLPVVFSEELTHSDMTKGLKVIHSAGFVYKRDEGGWRVSQSRKSLSLGIGPSSNDEEILNAFLTDGVSGLDLANWLEYQRTRAIRAGKTP